MFTSDIVNWLIGYTDMIFSDHMRIEDRSIALHQAVAERIRANPDLMEKARKNLQNYLKQHSAEGRMPPRALSEWQQMFEKSSVDEILQFLVSPGEKASRLRQSSPFAGILSPQQRWKIYATYRSGTYYSGSGKHRR